MEKPTTMPPNTVGDEPITDHDRHYRRTVFKDSASHGLVMRLKELGRSQLWLARKLGLANASSVSDVLAGRNVTMDTFSDAAVALGLTPHIVWGADPKAIEFPADLANRLQRGEEALAFVRQLARGGAPSTIVDAIERWAATHLEPSTPADAGREEQ